MICPSYGFTNNLPRAEINRRIKAALATKTNLGTPRKHDHMKILKLRKEGMSLHKIAKEIGCTAPLVSYVLRRNKLTKEKP